MTFSGDGLFMKEKNEFLTVEELAELLKVSPRTIRRIIKRKEMPVIRIGRQLRFRRQDVDNWLDTKIIAQTEGNKSA